MQKNKIVLLVVFLLLIGIAIRGAFNIYDSLEIDERYNQAETEINKDIQEGMNQVEIHDIIVVNCERYMKTQSDEHYCIYKYKSEH